MDKLLAPGEGSSSNVLEAVQKAFKRLSERPDLPSEAVVYAYVYECLAQKFFLLQLKAGKEHGDLVLDVWKKVCPVPPKSNGKT